MFGNEEPEEGWLFTRIHCLLVTDLTENVPHQLMCLNTWSLANRMLLKVVEPLEGGGWLEKVGCNNVFLSGCFCHLV